MRCAGAIGFALLFMAALGNGDAVAQPAQNAATGDATQQAEALFREADAFIVNSQWQAAEAKLLAAWKLKPTYDLAANLGHVEYRLKKFRDAAEHLEFAVRTWPFSGKPASKQLAVNRLEEAKKLVAVLRVKVSVPGTTVFVDGREIGTSPIDHDLFVEPGPRTIEAKLAGHDDAQLVVEAKKGEPLNVALTPVLARRPTAAAAQAVPDARVQPLERPSLVPVIVVGMASAVALGLGVAMTVASNDASSDKDMQRRAILNAGGQCIEPLGAFVARCAELSEAGSKIDTFGDVAFGSYVASGVFAAAATALALWPHNAGTSATVRAAPSLHAQCAGLVVWGSW